MSAAQTTHSVDRGATLVISLNFELGQDSIENGQWREHERKAVCTGLRETLPQLLAEMDCLEIAATQATVGGLLETAGRQALDHLPEPARTAVSNALREGQQRTFDGHDLANFRRVCRRLLRSWFER